MCLQKVKTLLIPSEGPELQFKEDISDTFDSFLVKPKLIKLINSDVLSQHAVLQDKHSRKYYAH